VGYVVVRDSERPELWEGLEGLSSEVWPECNLHGEVLGAYWSRLHWEFADFPVEIDHGRDLGSYWEPNVWIVHDL
jgi:hypothetical protein